MKKVFFTFSSQQLREDPAFVRSLIQIVDKLDDCRIGYRWFGEKGKEDKFEVYEKGVKALLAADLIIADATLPSTGVGQQIAFGMLHKIPVVVLINQSQKKVGRSSFLQGTKSSLVTIHYYSGLKNLESDLPGIVSSKFNDQLEKLNFVATKSIKKFLEDESRKLRISQSELLRQIITEWREKK